MKLKNAFGSLALVSLLALPSVGCVVRGSGHAYVRAPVAVVEIEQEPPPPRVVVVDTRPGFIWVQGRWQYNGGRWHWHDGHYERERAGYAWQQGRWERRGRGHVWVEGRWSAGGRATPARVERRHERREERRDDRRDHRDRRGGPVIRDHR